MDYTYFGARYYDSDASIWLSVDPMAKERPSLSPYNYCSLNPVMRVDPTGALDGSPDEYKLIKKTGKIKLITKTNDDFDRIYAQDGNKFDMDNPLVLEKGILGKEPNGNILGHTYTSSNEAELDKMYKFVASNSDPEWAFASFQTNGENLSMVSTSHKFTRVSARSHKRFLEDNPGAIMTRKSHSHALNEISSQSGYDVTMPSGFYSNGSPNPNATHGDRTSYKAFKDNFGSRVPYTFELFVPSQPQLNIEYNDTQIFQSIPISPK